MIHGFHASSASALPPLAKDNGTAITEVNSNENQCRHFDWHARFHNQNHTEGPLAHCRIPPSQPTPIGKAIPTTGVLPLPYVAAQITYPTRFHALRQRPIIIISITNPPLLSRYWIHRKPRDVLQSGYFRRVNRPPPQASPLVSAHKTLRNVLPTIHIRRPTLNCLPSPSNHPRAIHQDGTTRSQARPLRTTREQQPLRDRSTPD